MHTLGIARPPCLAIAHVARTEGRRNGSCLCWLRAWSARGSPTTGVSASISSPFSPRKEWRGSVHLPQSWYSLCTEEAGMRSVFLRFTSTFGPWTFLLISEKLINSYTELSFQRNCCWDHLKNTRKVNSCLSPYMHGGPSQDVKCHFWHEQGFAIPGSDALCVSD